MVDTCWLVSCDRYWLDVLHSVCSNVIKTVPANKTSDWQLKHCGLTIDKLIDTLAVKWGYNWVSCCQVDTKTVWLDTLLQGWQIQAQRESDWSKTGKNPGRFQIRFQYNLVPWVPDLSHLGANLTYFRSLSDTPGALACGCKIVVTRDVRVWP